MPVIVAYGDSNTWGYDPASGARFPPHVRWTGVMAQALGDDYRVIEEGLNGRTSVYEDPIEPGRNGATYLPPCLLSHAPLDLVIVALGCNDLKKRFDVPPTDIAAGIERLVGLALAAPVGPNGGPPRVLLVAPPPLAALTAFAEMFEGGTEKSRVLAARFCEVAERLKIGFVDAGPLIACSPLDGIHFEAGSHAILGAATAEAARMVLAQR